MLNKINSIILGFKNLGIKEGLVSNEIIRVKLIKDIFLWSIGLTFLLLLLGIYNNNIRPLGILGGYLILELIGLYLLYKKLYKLTYYYKIIVFSLFFFLVGVFFKPDFGVKFLFLLTIYLGYIYFDSVRIKYTIILVVTLIYLLSLYLSAFVPPQYVINLPAASLIKYSLFLFYLGWVGTLINHYHREVIASEKKATELIQTLQQKNQYLQDVSIEMERFNYIASHDLKSPLRSIIGFFDLMKIRLQQGKYDELPNQLEYIQASSQQMELLISDILIFSEINDEKNGIENVDLQMIIKDVFEILMPSFGSNHVQLFVTGDLPILKGNYGEMKMVFLNLIKNSFTYNETSQPTVNIDCLKEGEDLIIQIKDNGIGISKEFHEKIFHYFKRLHTYNDYKGSGLGLGICNKIIQKMGGKIDLKSELGQGSTFRIYLPNQQ